MTNTIEQIAGRLTAGAKRACLSMTAEWASPGKRTFNANGAWSLHWIRGVGGRGALCEREDQRDGKWMRSAYRLTPLGLELRHHLTGAQA